MRTISAVAALLRRLRVEREAVLLLFMLVAVTSFLVAASPRLFQQVSDEGLRYELADSTVVQRNLQFSTLAQIPADDDDPFGRVEVRGDAIWERLPPSVQAIVDERRFAVETPRFSVLDPPNYATSVALQYQDGIDEQVTFVAGRSPARVIPADGGTDAPRFEVALSTATADAILVGQGDVLRARVDSGDPMLRRVFPRPTNEVELEVVGLFDVRDPADPFWYGDGRMAQIAVAGTEEYPLALVSALFAPEAYADLRDLPLPTTYRWRYFVDTERIDDAYLETLAPDLRRLESTFGSTTGTPGDLVYRTGLLELVDRYEALRGTTQAAVSVAAIGPLGVAVGAVGLIALIIVRRRRSALVLARARGASAGQVLSGQLWEGLLITVPAALAGVLVATVAIAARADPVSARGAVIVALITTGLLVGVTWPLARRARRELERDDPAVRGTSPRRLVLEATIIGVALAATWLLRERSVGGEALLGIDPFLAAAPVLTGVAVGLLAIRIYPFPIRALAAGAGRRRDLVPVHGLRSIGRHPGAAYLPLLVMTMTIAVGVFSSVVETTIERGQLAASWQEVGADHRLEAPFGSSFAATVDPMTVDGVEAWAPALSVRVAPAFGSPGSANSTLFRAVDLAAYQAVLDGTPGAISVPAILADPPVGPGIGTADLPIPAVLSTRAPNGWPARVVGDTLDLQVKGQALRFVIVGFADSFPGIPRGSDFVVAPLQSVFAAYDVAPIEPSILFVRGPAESAAGLHEMLAATSAIESEISRHAEYAAVRAAPLVAAVGGGFRIALLVATAYAALAVVAVVALDAQRRARELAFLRTLGLSDRQMVGLTVVEHAPPVAVAVTIGVLLGLVVAWLLQPGLRLEVFIGPQAPVVLQVDWRAVLAVILAVIAVVVVALASSSIVARRVNPTDALRMGEG